MFTHEHHTFPASALCAANRFHALGFIFISWRNARRFGATRSAKSKPAIRPCTLSPELVPLVGDPTLIAGGFIRRTPRKRKNHKRKNMCLHRSNSTRQNNAPITEMIRFHCDASPAQSVHLAGAFNDWNPLSHPMHRHADGSWILDLSLPHGYHQYQFIVDGEPILDPTAMSVPSSDRLEQVSLIAIS